jgi:hypothetical protein
MEHVTHKFRFHVPEKTAKSGGKSGGKSGKSGKSGGESGKSGGKPFLNPPALSIREKAIVEAKIKNILGKSQKHAKDDKTGASQKNSRRFLENSWKIPIKIPDSSKKMPQ